MEPSCDPAKDGCRAWLSCVGLSEIVDFFASVMAMLESYILCVVEALDMHGQ